MINLEKTYNTNKQIRFKTSMQRSDLCDYSDAYIVVEGTITVEGDNKIDRKNIRLFLAFQKLIIHSSIMQKI